ncbi:MAG: T9SS type A sorting domain-containing protein, partial [FCB group bacterium]
KLNIVFIVILTLAAMQGNAQPKPQDTSDIVWQVMSPAEIRSIQFSPDSKWILTGHGDDYNTRIWNVADGSLIHEILNQEQPVFSHDGKFIASRKNQNIFIWSTTTWNTIKVIPTPCQVFQVQFSPEDKNIACALHPCGLLIYEIETSKLLKTIINFPFYTDPKTGEGRSADYFDFSPDGNFIVFSGQSSFIYDLNRDSIVATYPNIQPRYSPDGKFLMNKTWEPNLNQAMNYFDLNTGKMLWTKDMGQDNFDFCFSSDNKYVVTASEASPIISWDVQNGKEVYQYSLPYSAHTNIACSNDGKYVATCISTRLYLLGSKFTTVNEANNPIIKTIYPNPSTGMVKLEYNLQKSENIVLIISNQTGQKINSIDLSLLPSGQHNYEFDTHSLPVGIYFIVLKSNSFSETFKLIKE